MHAVTCGAGAVMLALALAAGQLRAQAQARSQAQAPARAATADGLRRELREPPIAVDTARLRPGTYQYEVFVTSDSGTMLVGMHTVTIGDASFATEPAWMVVELRESYEPFVVMTAVDTVLLSRGALRPLRWEGSAAGARFVAAFTGDSVYGGASAHNARHTFTVAGAPQLLTTEGALDAMLQAAPLAEGWAADAWMLVADLDTARVVPLQASVQRAAQLELPAGLFDVWVVRVTTEGAERWLWIDQRTQVVVRTAMSPAHMPGMIVERIVVNTDW